MALAADRTDGSAARTLEFPSREPLPCPVPAAWVPGVALGLGDLAAFAAVALAAEALREAIYGPMPRSMLLWGGSVGWVALRACEGLYPGYGLAGPEELRRSCVTTLVAALGHGAVVFATQAGADSRLVAVLAWACLAAVSFVLRLAIKRALVRLGLFASPVVVVGAGPCGELAIRELQTNRELGLVPVAVFDDDPTRRRAAVGDVPVIGSVEDGLHAEFPYPVARAILAIPESSARMVDCARAYARRYPRLAVVPGLFGLANLWVRQQPIGAMLTLEIHNNLLHEPSRRTKRVLDVTLAAPLLLMSLPVLAAAAAAVRALSPGPILFSQVREGIDGRPIRVWKIRTMVPDAEARLAEYLERDSAARAQWESRMKLTHDPRLLPVVGRLMRRLSIDELPQFWNVLMGEMSLVGPRPFPPYHVQRFPQRFRDLRRQVPAGITGLWQVTNRSDGDLRVQEAADSYYIQNWSLWLDLWILIQTARAVLGGKGAY